MFTYYKCVYSYPKQLFINFQFGHQENSSGQEILNALKHVRPGNGFEFKGEMFDKVIIYRDLLKIKN